LPARTSRRARPPVVCYHLSGDDWRLYQFKAQTAAYAVPAELDPIKWDALEPDQRVDRRIVQQSWLEEDLEIGDQIQGGDYAGMYVGEIIVPGGKYPSVEGGFRPAFASGGTGEDGIRNITGYMYSDSWGGFGEHRFIWNFITQYVAGALYSWSRGSYKNTARDIAMSNVFTAPSYTQSLEFDSGKSVPTADDNRVKTIAERVWRRAA
jgi:hypothetical protein